MNRRKFLGTMGAAGASVFMPSSFNLMSMYRRANAAVNYAGAGVTAPAVMPQVINIFLYGGPSELAGNLTNIADINANSQNKYDMAFDSRILSNDTGAGDGSMGFITPHGFWRGEQNAVNTHIDDGGAGGRYMQFMVEHDYMTVYRTLMKRKDDTRSHRESILMSQKGSLDIDASAGVGTRIAAILYQHRAMYEGTTRLAGSATPIGDIVNDLVLPFVSFEGESPFFALDPDFSIPLLYRGLTIDENFDNPYRRSDNPSLSSMANESKLDTLVEKITTAEYLQRYAGVAEAFDLRVKMDGFIQSFTPSGVADTTDAFGNTLPTNLAGVDDTANGGTNLAYPTPDSDPDDGNPFTNRIRAAVSLAIENPGSLYITVAGGFGDWDDHNNGVQRYPQRIGHLFRALQAAMLHIKYSGTQTNPGFTTPGGLSRPTDNIIINVYGDFGRLVNLNNSDGWDHANNQNLYTLGGEGVISAANGPAVTRQLGKVVGTTVREGTPGTNNQYTMPANGSYEVEPMSIAASVYSYFGVQNPETLTADDEINPDGVPAIDETVAGEDPLF